MRKASAVIVSAVMALGMSLTIGAVPAQASSPDTLVGVFTDQPECQRIGTTGVAQGWWDGYSCQFAGRYSYYFLYA